MFTHSFRDTFPPARFDDLPWTRVLVEQSPDMVTWTQIDDQAIAVDTSPDQPNPIDITTALASLERGWFRFRFRDASLALSPYTAAIFSPNQNPLTLEGLKRRLDSTLDTDDDKLQEYLDAAFLQAQAPHPFGCGRLLAPDPADPAGAPVTRTVKVRRGRALIADASVITSVTVDGATVSGWEERRRNGYVIQLTGLPSTATSAVVTGRFGFTAIPGNLADAIYILAARAKYEEAAQYADQIEILEGTAVQSYYRQLPPRTKLVFATYAVPLAIAGLA